MAKYTAFLLSQQTQQDLINQIPPTYPRIRADHITHRYGVDGFEDLFHPGKIEVIGVADDNNGMQALVVQVNGQQFKPDGNPYHITWSFDPKQKVADELGQKGKYRAAVANDLVRFVLDNPDGPFDYTKIDPPIEIKADPALVESHPDGSKTKTALPVQPQASRPNPPTCG